MKTLFDPLISKLFWGFLRHFLSDEWYAKIRYWMELDSWPDLQNPQKFTEKIQWIKLHERTALRHRVADRNRVRNYVAEKAGEDHLIPLIGCYEELTESIWQSLPAQFVLKANHGCEMVRIVTDKQQQSFEELKQQTKGWQQTDYFTIGREWVYKGLPRTLLAEALLLDRQGNIPKDYKFFCFHGEVKLIQIDYDRFGEQKRNLFDPDFNRIEGRLLYPSYTGDTPKPPAWDKAVAIAEQLSEDFSFIRVDLYLLDEKVYFGELTNYPGNGFKPFQPAALEHKVGSWLDLNTE